MNISRSEVDRIAALARLQFSEEESLKLASEMTRILEYMSVLDEIDTMNITEPSADPDQASRLRTDVVRHADWNRLLDETISSSDEHLAVPAVFPKNKS